MSGPEGSVRNDGNGEKVKSLAIRLDETQHAQLSFIAQLAGHSLGEEIKLAVEHWIEQARSNPELLAKAEEARAAIEREAEARKNAIATLFSSDEPAASGDTQATESGGRRRQPRRADSKSE